MENKTKLIMPNHKEYLEAQLAFESVVWVEYKQIDDRAAHMNAEALLQRKNAAQRIDDLLDRYILLTT